MRASQFLILSVLGLAGCESFNHYDQYPVMVVEHHESPKPVVVPVPIAAPVKEVPRPAPRREPSDIAVCPEFHFSPLGPTPDLPLAAMKLVKPGDDPAMENVEMDYIATLTKYIEKVKDQISRERGDYHGQCKKYQESQRAADQ